MKRFCAFIKKAAAFSNLQAAFCPKGFVLLKARLQVVVFKVSSDGKMKPFHNSPIPVPSPNWGRVRKFRGLIIEAKESGFA
jgi:hypothetical protein